MGNAVVHFYVEADDLQAVLDKATSLGARTVMPVTDFGGMVTIAMFSDPDGLLVGLVKSADPAQGDAPGPSQGDGAAVDWFEVLGRDAERAAAACPLRPLRYEERLGSRRPRRLRMVRSARVNTVSTTIPITRITIITDVTPAKSC